MYIKIVYSNHNYTLLWHTFLMGYSALLGFQAALKINENLNGIFTMGCKIKTILQGFRSSQVAQ